MSKWFSRTFGVILLLIGLMVAAGGVQLLLLGGSTYYLAGGLAVALTGVLVLRESYKAAWVYGAFLAATIAWSLWEVGLDGWQLTARLVGPCLFGLLFLIPPVSRKFGKASLAPAGAGLLGLLLILAASLQSPMEIASSGSRSKVAATGIEHPAEWRFWGRDQSGSRFSPLSQITPANVGSLELAWEFDTGHDPMDAPSPSPLQSTPIMVDGKLFLCTQTNVVFAIDPDTGKQIWKFDPKVDPTGSSAVRTCRGVAYYEDSTSPSAFCKKRIITATYGAQLIALDSATGKPCPTFGDKGFVDLKEGMGASLPGYYYVSSAPTIVANTVVVGGWVADNIGTDVPSGVVRGFDARTGALRWAWDVDNEANRNGPPAGKWYSRGTPNSWAPMSADEELGLVYVPTGNPAPDWFGALRSANSEKYGSSVVAIDAATGSVRWSFQTAHHDLWDYDVASQPTLIEIDGRDGPIPALVQPTKRGEIFLLDRRTGKPLAPVQEKPVPQKGAVPEERLAPTQPFSVGMPSLAGGRLVEKDMWGITPIDQLWCRIWFKKLRYDGPATPPGLDEAIVYPSIGGGMNWDSSSYDPERQVLLVKSLYYASLAKLVRRAETDRQIAKGLDAAGTHSATSFEAPLPMAGTPYGVKLRGFTTPLNTLCHAPPYGRLTAIDMRTRKILWQRPVGTIRDSGPIGISTGLPIRMGMPGFGGTLLTRSGLAFFGGVKERTFRAFSTENGEELWSARLPASGNANPMTYVSPKTGRQYVVIAATGHVTSQSMPLGRTFRAYALPKQRP